MQRFIAKQNIEHYRALLAVERDAAKRSQIEHLCEQALTELQGLEDDGDALRDAESPAATKGLR